MKKLYILLMFLSFTMVAHGQQTVATTGGNATGSGGSVSFTAGQIAYSTFSGTTGSIIQGVQQPHEISLAPTHFVPVWWPGNGMDHMNLYALTAKLDGADLQPGDEIGVFDGDVCVGVGVLTVILTGSNYLEIMVSRDDPDTPLKDGYTTGNTVIYRVWDSSAGTEITNAQATYVSGEGIFTPGATATFNLSALTSVTQNISLLAGWNIFSFAVQPPDMDMMVILNPLITAGTLIKVQDEKGHAIERLPDPIGWINNIGQMQVSEGYKIRVSSSTAPAFTGQPVILPYTITFDAGWNIMGYPSTNSQPAMTAFNPLITAGTLIKVQDELGHAIEKLPDPIGWINNIGNLNPGEGYKVRTSISTSLAINPSGKGEYSPEEPVMTPLSHFELCYSGKGLDHMNIYLVGPTAGGSELNAGDEVGIFDGERCVGAIVVNDLNKGYLPLIVSLDDPTTKEADGFIEGNPFELRLWDNQGGSENKTLKVEIEKGYTNLFEKQGTSVLKVDFEEVPHSSLGDAYPNPSSGTTTFTFTVAAESRVRLEIFNAMGEVIKVLVNQNMPEGTHKVVWDNTSDDGTKVKAGIYFYRLVMNYFSLTKSLVIR